MAFSSRIRIFASFLLPALLLGIMIPRVGFGQIYVSNYSQLYSAILSTQNTTSAVDIIITNSITLEGELPTIGGGTAGNVTITADSNATGPITINGDGLYRGFFIDVDGADDVNITGLRFDSCVATGGDGGDGAVGGGGGAGLGGAIYVKSGNVTLLDVSFKDNAALGGDGGTVLSDSTTIGGGGGMGGDGGSGATEGADRLGQTGDRNYSAGGGGGFGLGADGGDASDSTANDGQDGIAKETTTQGGKGYSSEKSPAGVVGVGGNRGGGGAGSYGTDEKSTASGGGGGIIDTTDPDNPYNNATPSQGGDGGYGGGGGGSTKLGGDGGHGGGGGGGGDKNYIPGPGERIGGDGGFGGGGGGAYSEPYVGFGGIGGGKGGTQEELYDAQLGQTTQAGGTGGGGLGAGGAVFVEGGTLSISYTQEYYDNHGINATFYENSAEGGLGGGGTAGDGDSLGSGLFLADGTTTINTLAGNTLRINDNIDGVAAASNLDWDDPDIFTMIGHNYYGTLNVTGAGILELRGDNTITSIVNIDAGATLLANSQEGDALGQYATVRLVDLSDPLQKGGTLELQKNETIGYLEGTGEVHLFYNNGTSDIGGKTLTVAGDEDPNNKGNNPFTNTPWGVFSGTIVGDNDNTTLEKLIKTGTGRLILSGDNKTPNEYVDSSSNPQTDYFETTIYQGTIEVLSNYALGGGDIYSKNVDFGMGINLRNSLEAGVANLNIANNIHIITKETIDGRVVEYNGFVVGGETLKLSGQITGGPLIVNMNTAANTLELANVDPANQNSYGETQIYRGIVIVNHIPANPGVTPQSNSLGTGTIRLLENGDGGISGSNNVDITQNIHIDSAAGLIDLTGSTYTISGNISGNGGIDVDVTGSLTLSGNNTYKGLTNITQGTVVLAHDTILDGGLSGAGTVNAGGKSLTIDGKNSGTFSGAIINTSSLTKSGTGTFGYNGTTTLPDITVADGVFVIGTAAVNAVPNVALTGSGQLQLTANTALTNLSAASTGNIIDVASYSLTLNGNNSTPDFYGAFKGTGTVVFDPTSPTTWNFLGNSTEFSGTMEIGNGTTVNANWFNSLGDGTATVNLNGGTLGVDVPGYYGTMQVGELNVTDDSTLNVETVYVPLVTENLDIAGVTLAKTGDGYLVVTGSNTGASTGGTIDLQDGGIWLQKTYDTSTGQTTYDAGLGNTAIQVSGTNTYLNVDVNPDTTNPPTEFANQIDMAANSKMTVTANDGALDLTGNLSSFDDTANMVFAGTADKTLKGDNSSYTGTLTAAAGLLNLQSQTAADLQNASVVVQNGATLTATTGTKLANATFESGSTFYVDVNAVAGGTFLDVQGGNVTIEDGAIAYLHSDGVIAAQNFVLINGGGSAPGNFSLIDNEVGKRAVGTWTSGRYEVEYVTVDYMTAATTSGQRAVATYLTQLADNLEPQGALLPNYSQNTARSPELDALLNTVESLTGNAAGYAYDDLGGEIYNSAGVAQLQSTTQMFTGIARNLRMTNSVTGAVTANHRPNTSGLGTGDQVVRGKPGLSSGWTGWAAFSGIYGDTSSNSGRYGYDYKNQGGVIALEPTTSGGVRLGIYYAYNKLEIDTNSSIGYANNNDHFIGMYARCFDSAGYTSLIGGFGFDDYDVGRTVLAGTQQQAFLSDSFSGWQGGLYVERGLPMLEVGHSFLQPYLGLQYVHLTRNSIEESGVNTLGSVSAARLIGRSADMDSLRTNLGARVVHDFQTGWGNLQLEGNISWMHEMADDNLEGTFRFAGPNPGTFISTANSLGRDWVFAGIGANLALSDRFSLIGGYDLMFNDYQTFHTANGGFCFSW